MARIETAAVLVGDIRCGCGGLCDSGLPCPMAYLVPVCGCGGIPLRSTVKENGTRYFLRHGAGQRGCRVFGDLARWT